MPGGATGPSCPVIGMVWKYGGGCPGGSTSGHMTNVAPEHSRNVTPEMRTKLGASTPWQNEIDPAGHVRVVSGDFSNLAADASTLVTPKYRSSSHDTEVPNTWDPNIEEGKHVVSGNVS